MQPQNWIVGNGLNATAAMLPAAHITSSADNLGGQPGK
jgi:hypothetical protein